MTAVDAPTGAAGSGAPGQAGPEQAELERLRSQVASLTRRAARERSARQEAERIGEASTASMYAALQQVEQAQALIDQTTDLVLMLDERYRVTYANASAEQHLGQPGGSLAGTHVRRLVDTAGWRRWCRHGEPALAAEGTWHADADLLSSDGTLVPVSAVVIAHPTSPRAPRRWSVVARDVSAERALRRELQHRADHDALTGLGNRSVFFTALRAALDGLWDDRPRRASRRPGRGRVENRHDGDRAVLGLLYLDLDGFKRLNDERGHEAGDRLLQLVAQQLRACLRADDLPCRLGGDEFTALLPGLRSPRDAELVADRLLEALADLSLDGEAVSTAVSIGVATCTRSVTAGGPSADVVHALTANDLVHRADEAMYAAKRAGRGRRATAAPALLVATRVSPRR